MSKILILTNHSYMLYRFRLELLRELAKTNEVVLSMPFVGHEEDFQAEGFRCVETALDRRGVNPKVDFKLFCFYRKLLKTEKPDLVITYSIKPNIYGGVACMLAGIPYCANVQGLGTAFQRKFLAKCAALMYKTAFRKVKTVFFENEANADEFIRRKIVTKDRAKVLSGAGVNLERFNYQAYPENEVPHFLFLSRIMQEKGVDELFEAIRRLHQEKVPCFLDLVGFFEDEYKSTVDQLEELGIAKFHGFQQEPIPFYAAADCVVLPSYHEGMSNVLLEAAAMGRPVIASDIPGCRESVEDGVSGFLCKARDMDSLYEQMLRMARMSVRQREAMGQAGRGKMEREFDKMQVVCDTICALPLFEQCK